MSETQITKRSETSLDHTLSPEQRFRSAALIGGLIYNLRIQRQLGWEQIQMAKVAKESKEYLDYADTWEEFCTKFIGCSYKTVERKLEIAKVNGKDYFDLIEMTPVTPGVYAALNVKDGCIHVGANKIEIRKENEAEINEVVRQLKRELAQRTEEAQAATAKAEKESEKARTFKAANDKSREEIIKLKKQEENLYALASPLERILLRAQAHISMAASQMQTVFDDKEITDLERRKLTGLANYGVKLLLGAAGEDPGDFLNFAAEPPRDLISEYLEEHHKA